jgi:hypothetical protein
VWSFCFLFECGESQLVWLSLESVAVRISPGDVTVFPSMFSTLELRRLPPHSGQGGIALFFVVRLVSVHEISSGKGFFFSFFGWRDSFAPLNVCFSDPCFICHYSLFPCVFSLLILCLLHERGRERCGGAPNNECIDLPLLTEFLNVFFHFRNRFSGENPT